YFQPGGSIPGAGVVPITRDRGASWRNHALDLGALDVDGATFVANDSSIGGLTVLDPAPGAPTGEKEIWVSGYISDYVAATGPFGFIRVRSSSLPVVSFGSLLSAIGHDFGCLDGCYLGNDVVLLGGFGNGQPKIARSTSRGVLWTTVALPAYPPASLSSLCT